MSLVQASFIHACYFEVHILFLLNKYLHFSIKTQVLYAKCLMCVYV